MIDIEKGVPIPGRRQGRIKYPWGKLAVGDSFLMKEPPIQARDKVKYYRKKYGYKLVTRLEFSGTRVWRVE